MIFVIHNPDTACPYRLAGRALTRSYGMGAISLARLSEYMDCERYIRRWS